MTTQVLHHHSSSTVHTPAQVLRKLTTLLQDRVTLNEDLMDKRNHRKRRVWKTIYTWPYIWTHKNIQ